MASHKLTHAIRKKRLRTQINALKNGGDMYCRRYF